MYMKQKMSDLKNYIPHMCWLVSYFLNNMWLQQLGDSILKQWSSTQEGAVYAWISDKFITIFTPIARILVLESRVNTVIVFLILHLTTHLQNFFLLPFPATWSYVALELLVSKGGIVSTRGHDKKSSELDSFVAVLDFHCFEPTGKENRAGCHSNGCGINQEEIRILFTMGVWWTVSGTL